MGNKFFGVKLLLKSSMNFLAHDPANCSAWEGMLLGPVTSRILRDTMP